MKINPYLIIFVLLTSVAMAQGENDRKVYFDSLWRETDSDDYVYYRVIKDYNTTKSEYQVTDYFRSGKPQMIGRFADRDAQIKIGDFVFFHENGQKYSEAHYQKTERSYRPAGAYNSWYENGSKKLEAEYVDCGKPLCWKFKIRNYWDKDNKQLVKDGNGTYEEQDKTFKQSGPLRDGFKNGEWTGIGIGKHKSFSFKDQFDNGEFVSGVMTDSIGKKYPYTQIEVQPRPRKGIDHFYKFVAKKFNIPANVGATGRILVTFTIDKNGEATDIEILRGIDKILDAEAQRVVADYPDWEPGKYRGMDARAKYTLPITIK